MPKYMIHTIEKRKWYVDDYICKWLKEQGANDEDITIYVDEKLEGNLEACLKSFDSLRGVPGGTWHLQDDIFLTSDFVKRTKEHDKGLVCGYCYEKYERGVEASGSKRIEFMWMSFPCIRIPNDLAAEFVDWMRNVAVNEKRYSHFLKEKKYDDLFFRFFMSIHHPTMHALNLKPNLVDHVDYLVGGSAANAQRGNVETHSWFLEEKERERVKEFEKEMGFERKKKKK